MQQTITEQIPLLPITPAPTVSEIEAILKEVHIEDMPDEYEIIEEGTWEQEHKYQHSYVILKHLPSATFWGVSLTRYGTYWEGYETEVSDVRRVEPREETITVIRWETVKCPN